MTTIEEAKFITFHKIIKELDKNKNINAIVKIEHINFEAFALFKSGKLIDISLNNPKEIDTLKKIFYLDYRNEKDYKFKIYILEEDKFNFIKDYNENTNIFCKSFIENEKENSFVMIYDIDKKKILGLDFKGNENEEIIKLFSEMILPIYKINNTSNDNEKTSYITTDNYTVYSSIIYSKYFFLTLLQSKNIAITLRQIEKIHTELLKILAELE